MKNIEYVKQEIFEKLAEIGSGITDDEVINEVKILIGKNFRNKMISLERGYETVARKIESYSISMTGPMNNRIMNVVLRFKDDEKKIHINMMSLINKKKQLNINNKF